MKTNKITENWIRQTKLEPDTSASMDSRILMDSYVAMPSEQVSSGRSGYRRIIMKTSVKFAAAAVFLFMVFAGWRVFDKSSSGVVWADVAQKVRQAKVVAYRAVTTMTGNPIFSNQGKGEIVSSTETIWMTQDTVKVETTTVNDQLTSNTYCTYLLPKEKKLVHVYPMAKMYYTEELNDNLLAKIKQQNRDPREWVQKIINSQYKSLSKTTLDGIEVEGLETTDPAITGGVFEKALARLWVDVKTGYPVQMEQDFDMNEGKTQMHIIIRDFQWDVAVDADLFNPNIPADFTPVQLKTLSTPDMDENTAIAGLKRYAELANQYPENLNPVTLINNSLKMIDSQSQGLSQSQVKDKTEEMIVSSNSLGGFYMTLVQDKKDPAYYGKTVTVGDGKAVLLRWKTNDTTYRVIRGDLSINEMSAEQLKQIEPKIP
jgi:hypothetical protein